jgi:hypothetical protein
MRTHSPTTQRGAATLGIALMMVFAILLSVAFANRSVIFEAKTSANQYRAAQAFEAAEAGLDWAIAQLNRDAPIGDDCLPSTQATASPFREHGATVIEAACIESDGAWACSCPVSGAPQPVGAGGSTLGFAIRLAPASQSGLLQLTSIGCSESTAACLAGGGSGGAKAQVQVLVGRLPGLDSPPAAALTVRGTPSFSSPGLVVRHLDPRSGGITVHSGGNIDSAQLQLTSSPGTPAAASVISDDPALAQLSTQGLFASVFRMGKATWRAQPAVRIVDCKSSCDTSLAQTTPTSLMWLDGGLKLDTPIVLGTPERPVLLVVDGPVDIHANAVIHGVVYATSSSWTDTAGASINGAVLVEGDLQATGATQINHNAALLLALHDHTGSYARVPGSWRDF